MRVRFGVLAFVALVGCGSEDGSTFPDGGDGRGEGGGGNNPGDCLFASACSDAGSDGTVPAPCVGLQCQQVQCGGGASTTVSGTVYAPNGTLPLYNVIVYVPNKPPDPIPSGASCDKCGATVTGSPVVTTLTDAEGKFVLKDVPVGTNIPLVMQIGKWRRQIVIPEVKQCVDTPLTDPQVTRLPKDQSEGDMPKIAVTTGSADPLGCILPKLGIAPSEFTATTGSGKVNFFIGNGTGPSYATNAQATFWNDVNKMKPYDIIILSCEGAENQGTKPMASRVELQKYLDQGGRVFASHYHYVWFQYGPQPLPTTATWAGDGMGPGNTTPFRIDTTFPKGKALADWLKFVEPTLPYGEMPINQVRNDVGTVNSATSQRWVYASTNPQATKYLSFNTPVGQMPDQQCGKAVFGDMHIGAGANAVNANFPMGCSQTLTPQEKALIFLFFDLSSCIQKESEPPKPPQPN
jgi:hypothetical protein